MQSPLRLERRLEQPRWLNWGVPAISLVGALLLGAVVLFLTGKNPASVYSRIVDRGFFGADSLTRTIISATPLAFTGLCASVAFRMGLINIGGEGQLYLGMIGGAWAGLALGPHLPTFVMVPVVLLVGAICGAAWIFVPAFVRARLGTSEIVTTLLLTYVAVSLINYFIYTSGSFFRAPDVEFPMGRTVAPSAQLSSLGDTRLYPTFFFVVALAFFLYWVVKKTEFGYRIQVIADSPRAAHYAGISARRTTMSVMLISGALAGMGGATLIVGTFGKLDPGITLLGYGYAGIVIAALARNNFSAIVVSGILFAGLRVGGDKLQITSDTPIHIGVILQGAILLFALGGEAFRRYKIRAVRMQTTNEVTA